MAMFNLNYGLLNRAATPAFRPGAAYSRGKEMFQQQKIRDQEAQARQAGLEEMKARTNERGEQRQMRAAQQEQLAAQFEYYRGAINQVDPRLQPQYKGMLAAGDFEGLNNLLGAGPQADIDLEADIGREERGAGRAEALATHKAELKAGEKETGSHSWYNPNNPSEQGSARPGSAKEEDFIKDDWVKFTAGQIGTPSEWRRKPLNPGDTFNVESTIAVYEHGTKLINRVMGLTKSDPGLFSVMGRGMRALRDVTGAAGSVAAFGEIFPDSEITEMAESVVQYATSMEDRGEFVWEENDKFDLFENPELSAIEVYENSLSLILARSRASGDRLLSSTIKEAHKDVSLTGIWDSPDRVFNKLNAVFEELEDRRETLERQLPTLDLSTIDPRFWDQALRDKSSGDIYYDEIGNKVRIP